MLNADASEKYDVHPIDEIVEEFGQLEEQLNILKESMTESIELVTESIKEPIAALTSYESFNSLEGTVTDEIEMIKIIEVSSNDAFDSITETVTENLKVVADEIDLLPEYDGIDAFHGVRQVVTESVKEYKSDANASIETKEEYTSPIVQVMRVFGDLWESLAGGSEEEESWEDLQPCISSVSHADVHLLMFLVFAIIFMLVLSFLLCSYCKRKMWEREQW